MKADGSDWYKARGNAQAQYWAILKKYKGDFYEDDPSIEEDWENYKEIAENGCLLKFCTLASYQTKFVDAYSAKFMDLFKEQYVSTIKADLSPRPTISSFS